MAGEGQATSIPSCQRVEERNCTCPTPKSKGTLSNFAWFAWVLRGGVRHFPRGMRSPADERVCLVCLCGSARGAAKQFSIVVALRCAQGATFRSIIRRLERGNANDADDNQKRVCFSFSFYVGTVVDMFDDVRRWEKEEKPNQRNRVGRRVLFRLAHMRKYGDEFFKPFTNRIPHEYDGTAPVGGRRRRHE